MAEHRRRVLLRATAVATGVAVQQVHRPAPAVAAPAGACPPPLGPVAVGPDDPRYADLVRRGNRRFVGTPDQVRVVGSTEQVRAAVQAGVRAGQRIAVRSGGHCFEDFVDNPQVRLVIDLSGMTGVCYDPLRSGSRSRRAPAWARCTAGSISAGA